MHLFITDDCNSNWDDKCDFFLYGGIIVPENLARTLAEQLKKIKEKAGLQESHVIKWPNIKKTGQPPISKELHAELKGEVLKLVAASGCKIIICSSPQDFYHFTAEGKKKIDTETLKRTQEYALTDVMGKFNYFLKEEDALGMILADKFGENIHDHMHKHCVSMFPNSKRISSERIIHPVVQLDNEFSPLHQINDVVLGAVYHSLREIGYNFLPLIKDNFWKDSSGDTTSIIGKGFSIFPLRATTAKTLESKTRLRSKFLRLVNNV